MQLICQTYFLSAEKYFAITEGADKYQLQEFRVLAKRFHLFFKKSREFKTISNGHPHLANLLLVELQIKVWGASSQCWPACCQLLRVYFQRVFKDLTEKIHK